MTQELKDVLDSIQATVLRGGALESTQSQILQSGLLAIYSALSGTSLQGSQYVFVQGNGTELENGIELQNTYNLAKTMSPSADNRITVVVAPGNYKLAEALVLDTEFVDLVSLTGNADVVLDIDIEDPFEFNENWEILKISPCLYINTNNVYVKGIHGKIRNSVNYENYWGIENFQKYILPIVIGDNLPNITVENCVGGSWSFGFGAYDLEYAINNVSGTFINCISGIESFGGNCEASGTFINCKVDKSMEDGTLNVFTSTFGSFSIASGTFTNCYGGYCSFAAGVGINKIASGTFTNCEGGLLSFAGNGVASGTFINCFSGEFSFGSGNVGSITGKLFFCRLISGTFKTVSGGGRTYYCIDGNGNPNNQ